MNTTKIEINENLLVFFDSPDLSPIPHVHKDIEIVYVKKGHASCYADNNFYTLKTDDMFVAFPNQLHYYTDYAIGGEYYVFIFSANLLHNLKTIFMNNTPVNNVINIKENRRMLQLLNDFINENSEYKETMRIGILNLLLSLFLLQTELTHGIETDSSTFKKILDYCNRNYSTSITLDDVAAAVHCSKFYISNLFNKKLNIGFNKYINALRINEAMYLMQDKNNSLSYIAQESGFGSIRSFNRAFNEIMNTTPTSYIKQMREQKILNKSTISNVYKI